MTYKWLTIWLIYPTVLILFASVFTSCKGGHYNYNPFYGDSNIGFGARLPDGVESGEATTLVFTLVYGPEMCTHSNSNGIPVPDGATLYPDGIGGTLSPVSFNLDAAIIQEDSLCLEITYSYPDNGVYMARATVSYAGQTAFSPSWETHF